MAKQKASFSDITDEKWKSYIFDNKFRESERLEDAAKFLSGMISISLTIFIRFNENVFYSITESISGIIVMIIWLFSLALSFFVFFPFPYKYHEESIASIKFFHKKMVKRKRILLLCSTICYFLVLSFIGILFIVKISKT